MQWRSWLGDQIVAGVKAIRRRIYVVRSGAGALAGANRC